MVPAGAPQPGNGPADDTALVTAALDALLPKGLTVLPGIDLAATCIIGADPARRGGDWFDTAALGDGRLAVLVGDVPGSGLHAVAAMSQLRSVLLAALLRTGDAQASLRELQTYAARLPDARATTVVVVVLDPDAGTLTYCTAGHPPPLVVPASGEPCFLEPTGSGPLERTAQEFALEVVEWAAGDTVVIYSDGVLDQPSRARSGSSVALATAAEECRGLDEPMVSALVRRLPAELMEGLASRDDVMLVAAERRVVPVAELALDLPATGETLLTVRSELHDWLTPLSLSAIDAMSLQHAVGELLANVVRHAYPPGAARGGVRLRARVTEDAAVEVDVHDDGAWRPRPDREVLPHAGGRGLNLARLLTDQLRLDSRVDGTSVQLRFEPQRPVGMFASPSAAPVRRARPMNADVRLGALVITGPLDLDAADELRQLLGRASQGSTRDAEVDLTGVDVLDSTAVQVLLDAQQASAVNGRALRLVAASGSPAQQVLDLVRLPYRLAEPPESFPA